MTAVQTCALPICRDKEELMKSADIALYETKKKGDNQVVLFEAIKVI